MERVTETNDNTPRRRSIGILERGIFFLFASNPMNTYGPVNCAPIDRDDCPFAAHEIPTGSRQFVETKSAITILLLAYIWILLASTINCKYCLPTKPNKDSHAITQWAASKEIDLHFERSISR